MLIFLVYPVLCFPQFRGFPVSYTQLWQNFVKNFDLNLFDNVNPSNINASQTAVMNYIDTFRRSHFLHIMSLSSFRSSTVRNIIRSPYYSGSLSMNQGLFNFVYDITSITEFPMVSRISLLDNSIDNSIEIDIWAQIIGSFMNYVGSSAYIAVPYVIFSFDSFDFGNLRHITRNKNGQITLNNRKNPYSLSLHQWIEKVEVSWPDKINESQMLSLIFQRIWGDLTMDSFIGYIPGDVHSKQFGYILDHSNIILQLKLNIS